MNSGQLFVISAPSGAGKTTVLKTVMSENQGLGFSVSHTTREPREGESNGKDYHFVSHDEFERMIADNLFLEYARVHTNFYGTSRPSVEELLAQGMDVILDIDVQGASILREQGNLDAVYIFIAPPSMEELERRLRGRGTESAEKIEVRLENAKIEMRQAPQYDYLVVNERLDEAIRFLTSIIWAERARGKRKPDGLPINLADLTGEQDI